MAISKSQLLKAKIITKMAYFEVLKEEIEEMSKHYNKLVGKYIDNNRKNKRTSTTKL